MQNYFLQCFLTVFCVSALSVNSSEMSPSFTHISFFGKLHVKMETRLQSRCRGCNPFSLFPSFPQSWTTQRPGWRRSTLWCTGCPRRTGRCWSCWWDTWPRRLTTHDLLSFNLNAVSDLLHLLHLWVQQRRAGCLAFLPLTLLEWSGWLLSILEED